MTHGGAGAMLPLLILLLLALPITLLWVFKGPGKSSNRRVIGFSQIAILVGSLILLFIQVESIQSIAFVSAFVVLLCMLLTPAIFKNRV